MNCILTCNAGSTNTKLALYDVKTLQRLSETKTFSREQTLDWIKAQAQHGIIATSHRIVHGGRQYTEAVRLTDAVLADLKKLIPLAPLHQPAALQLIEEVQALFPELPHIGCFDTAFHHTIDELEKIFPLPRGYADEGILRYGFHGLSYAYIASRLPEYVSAEAGVVVAHLGGGASMCAMRGFQSVATTMGFSTMDGLMMSTRPGALDVGIILHLLQEKAMSLDVVTDLLYRNCGLKGVSGISGDMQELLASDSASAMQAIDLYCYLAAKQLASLLPALGGLDALVFTGGIGEHVAVVREKICNHMRWMGLQLDVQANQQNATCISSDKSNVSVLALPTDEEYELANSAKALL